VSISFSLHFFLKSKDFIMNEPTADMHAKPQLEEYRICVNFVLNMEQGVNGMKT